MQKKLVSALFGATGLMLSTAFSGVYGMEESKGTHEDLPSSRVSVIYAGERKPKVSPTGLFTQSELSTLQSILMDHFKAVYAAQEDGNEHAYLFVPNPELTTYAQAIYDHLYEKADQSQFSHQQFFKDFGTYIENDNVSGVVLLFSIARFQTIRDEHKTRDPQQLGEEQSFVASLPNPSEAIYSVLTRPAFKDDGSFYGLNDVITELQELIGKPSNPGKSTFGSYSFKTTEQMTAETCKKLEKALFTEIPPHIPMPIVGKGYLPMPLIVKSLINDLFPAAFPFSTSQDDLMAHGLHFSDTTFAVHDFLHMLGDPRNETLYRYAESLLQASLMQDVPEAEAISAVVARVAPEYAEFKALLTRFVDSPAAKRNPLAIRGLFWILHEEPSALEKIFSIEAQKFTVERFHDLVTQAKNDIDGDLIKLDLSLALADMDMETEEVKNIREIDAHINPNTKLALKILPKAQLATEACSEKIQALLFAADSNFKKRVEEPLSKRTEHSKVLTYVTYSKQFTDIGIAVGGLPYFDPETGERVAAALTMSWHNYPSIKSYYALQIEAQHNLKALPKALQEFIQSSFSRLFEIADTEEASIEEQRAFICAVNEGLKANVDAFGAAMDVFLTQDHA